MPTRFPLRPKPRRGDVSVFNFVYQHRVRYRECDPMGIVYHTHYLDYFEAARTEALRHIGLPYRKLEESGVIMPVVDLAVSYHRPALYDDLIDIQTQMTGVPDTRVRIDYVVTRSSDGTRLVTGHVTLCFVDRERNRPIRAPEMVRNVFRRLYKDEQAT